MKNIIKYMIVCSLFNLGLHASQRAGQKRKKSDSAVDAAIQSDVKKVKLAPQVTVPVVPVQIHTVSFVPVDAFAVSGIMNLNVALQQFVRNQEQVISQMVAIQQRQNQVIDQMQKSLQEAGFKIEQLEDERDKKLPHRYLSEQKSDREGATPSPTVLELMRQSKVPEISVVLSSEKKDK